MAQVLTEIIGPAGQYIISIGLLISVCGAFLSWTVLASEAPYLCAKEGMFPKKYAEVNQAGTPVRPLLLTNVWIQVSLIAVMFAGSTYDTLLIIASEMILIPYFLVGAYVLKLSITKKEHRHFLIVGLGATVYGVWLLYASGLNYLLMSAVLYVPGLYFYVQAKKEQGVNPFKGRERFGAGALSLVALLAVALFSRGMLNVAL